MSLNNKKLAIVLSIIAVIVVFYQLFLNKPDKPVTRVSQPVSPAINPSVPSPVSPGNLPEQEEDISQTQQGSGSEESTGSSDAEGGLVIDFNTPVLLNRVPHEMMAAPVPREMPSDFGSPIFTTASKESAVTNEPQYEKEIEFTLQAIIINPGGGVATINGKNLRVGDFIQDAEIISIEKGKVTLKLNNETFELTTLNRVKKISVTGGNGEN